MKQKCWKMYISLATVYLQLRMCNAEPTGNALVSCSACQAVQVQNFACDVNCQIVKGNQGEYSNMPNMLYIGD